MNGENGTDMNRKTGEKKIEPAVFGKGLIIGGTMLVPGVSGGSMAMILGIYDRLITSVSSFMKHKRESAFFLLTFAIGGLAGMFAFSRPLVYLIEKFPMPTLYFFMGAVAGGIPLILKEAEIKRFSFRSIVYLVLGIAIVVAVSYIPMSSNTGSMDAGAASFLLLGAAGFIAAVALVLPGISVSYLLLVMGLYDETMRAISQLYMPFLIPLGLGLVIGIILTTKLLEKAMNDHPHATYLIILGFLLGSVRELYPGIPTGIDIITSIVTLCVGFASVMWMSRKELFEK